MKYKVTLNGKTYEVEVEAGKAMLVDEYEAYAPAPAPAAAPAPTAAPAPAAAPAAPAAPAPAAPLAAGETVSAPMPGNILSVNVSQGVVAARRTSSAAFPGRGGLTMVRDSGL